MVQAFKAKRKTQTRRILNPQPRKLEVYPKDDCWFWHVSLPNGTDSHGGGGSINHLCKLLKFRYRVGDHCYIGETWAQIDITPIMKQNVDPIIVYRADGEDVRVNQWKSARFMPQWAARFFVEITNIRFEKIQDITEEACFLEGVDLNMELFPMINRGTKARRHFQQLWDSLYGPGAWERNDWVGVVEFTQILDNPIRLM
jgi:hypothetical protein